MASAVLAGAVHARGREDFKTPRWASYFFILAGLALAFTGQGTGLNALKAWAMILLAYSAGCFLLKGRILAFLKVFFVLSACAVPLPFLFEILSYLQRTAVAAGAAILGGFGIIREVSGGLVQFTNGENIIVAESCSGFKSILVYFTLAVFGSYLFNLRPAARWALAALSIPAAWTVNTTRLALILWIGGIAGTEKAFSAWHSGSGAFFYAAGFVLMFALASGLKRFFKISIFIIFFLAVPAGISVAASVNFTDTSVYAFTSNEGRWQTATDIFHKKNVSLLPLRLGKWNGKNLSISDPLPSFLRLYVHDSTRAQLYLQPVYGREETAFHTAEVCYINAGWKMDDRGYRKIEVNGVSLPVRFATARYGSHRHLILYWYAWPSARRNISDGCLMLRISVEVTGGDDDALKSASNFISEMSRADFGLKSGRAGTLPKPDLSAWMDSLKEKSRRSVSLSPEIKKRRNLALRWLLNQTVPNPIVRRPARDRRNLILSYRTDPSTEDYRYVFSKSALYDNALAAIALTMAGRPDKASDILSALERVSDGNGDLFFSFNTHNSWPNAGDSDGAVVRTGASAWAGLALCFHLSHALMRDPQIFSKDPDSLSRLKFAESLAECLLKYRVEKPGDLRRGLFTGGRGSYSLKLKDGKIIEEFSPANVAWCSVEHNIDVYFFFTALARITGNARWKKIADEVRAALLKTCWNDSARQFNRGVNILEKDKVQSLDCASWGACALASFGEASKAGLAAKSASKYRSEHGGAAGYKPYAAGPIYEEAAAQKFYFSRPEEGLWENTDMVWPEGTLGAGLGFWKTGDADGAREILEAMWRLQDDEGGIYYASRHISFQFSTSPSAASAAWYVILSKVMEDPISDALFWDR